jgi:hypothetical protein
MTCCCSLKEHYNTAYDCAFLSAAATGAKEGLLLAAYHSGDIRCAAPAAVDSQAGTAAGVTCNVAVHAAATHVRRLH